RSKTDKIVPDPHILPRIGLIVGIFTVKARYRTAVEIMIARCLNDNYNDNYS
ncbi:Hypothetical protein FKW44_007236, partial [Caligus rogercresseyi]